MCKISSKFSGEILSWLTDYETHRRSHAFRRREKVAGGDFAALGKFDSQFLARQYLNIVYACLRIRLGGGIHHTGI